MKSYGAVAEPKDITTKEYVDGAIPRNSDFNIYGLGDTTITSPANSQILQYNGKKWINTNPQSFSQQQANWDENSPASVQFIQNKPSTMHPSGIAGGDLSGSYPNPLVVGGRVDTAKKLETPRSINGINFDGTANITVVDDTKIPYDGVIQNTNPFGGKKLYQNTLDNAFAGANVKYFTKATLHKKIVSGVTYPKPINPTDITLPQWEDSPVASDVSFQSNNLFNNNYEDGITVTGDYYLKVSIDFNQDGMVYFSGYPYGTYFLSYYYVDTPDSAQVRCYNGFQAHTIGYKTLDFTNYIGSIDKSGFIQQCTDNGNYKRRNIEFIIFGNNSHKTTLTQIEWKLIRPSFADNSPIFSNYGSNKCYRPFILGTNLENTIILNPANGGVDAKDIISNGQLVVVTNDYRMTNSRPASDVYAWAKSPNAPSIPPEYVTDTEMKAFAQPKGDYATNATVSSGLSAKLSLSGGSMSGNIDMVSNYINNLPFATQNHQPATFKQLNDAIAGLGTVFSLLGAKATVAELPTTSNTLGDVWYVESESVGYIWLKDTAGTLRWEQFGKPVDLSGYLTKAGLLQSIGQVTDNTMSQKSITDSLSLKVDKESGKQLSSNNFTNESLAKLNGIAAGAEVNVNADWNSSAGDSAILNKPTSLPANGGNADTIGGIGKDGFVKTVDSTSNFISTNNMRKIPLDSIVENTIGYSTAPLNTGLSDGAVYAQAYSQSWVGEIYQDYRTGQIWLRGKNSGAWQPWRKVWDSLNDGDGSGLNADLLDGKHASELQYTLQVGGTSIGGVKNGGNVVIDASGNMNASSGTKKYVMTFDINSWGGTTEFSISISATVHGSGENPVVTILNNVGGLYTHSHGYPNTGYRYTIDSNGNVTIYTGKKFAGKVIIM